MIKIQIPKSRSNKSKIEIRFKSNYLDNMSYRFSTIFAQKIKAIFYSYKEKENIVNNTSNSILNKYEYKKSTRANFFIRKQQKSLTLLNHTLGEIDYLKIKLNAQRSKLWKNVKRLDKDARTYIMNIDNDKKKKKARIAIELKNTNLLQIRNLDKLDIELQVEEVKLRSIRTPLLVRCREARIKVRRMNKIRLNLNLVSQPQFLLEQIRFYNMILAIIEDLVEIEFLINKTKEIILRIRGKIRTVNRLIDSAVFTNYRLNPKLIEEKAERITLKMSVNEELKNLSMKK